MSQSFPPNGFDGHASDPGQSHATASQAISGTNGDEDEITRLEPRVNPDGSFDGLFRRFCPTLSNHRLHVPSVTFGEPCSSSQSQNLSEPLIPEIVPNAPVMIAGSQNNTMNEFLPGHQSSQMGDDPFDISGLQLNQSERRRLEQSRRSVVNNHQNSPPQPEVHMSNPSAVVNASTSLHSNASNGVPQSIPYGSTPLNVHSNVFAVPSQPRVANRNYSLENQRLSNDMARQNFQFNVTAPPVFNPIVSEVHQLPMQEPAGCFPTSQRQNVAFSQPPFDASAAHDASYRRQRLHGVFLPNQPEVPQIQPPMHAQAAYLPHHNPYGQPAQETNVFVQPQITQFQPAMQHQHSNVSGINYASSHQSAMQGSSSLNNHPYNNYATYNQQSEVNQNRHTHPSAHNEPVYRVPGNQRAVGGWNVAQQQQQHQPQIVYYPQPRRYTQRDYPQLQSFTGQKPEEWPSWIAYYRSTTAQYDIPPHENFERIKKAIAIDSPAYMAVRHLLHLPNEGETIIGVLQDFFGQPHFILQKLKEKAEKFPQIADDRMDRLLALCADVENLVATLRTCAGEAHMVEGSLLNILVRKLPVPLQLQWGGSQFYGLHLANFNNWLKSIRPSAIRIIDQPLGANAWQHAKNVVTNSTANRRVNTHQRTDSAPSQSEGETQCAESAPRSTEEKEARVKTCKVCKSNDYHKIENCETFQGKSVNERWKTVRALKVCFCCLASGHGSNKCTKRCCEIDGCQRKHHELLHAVTTSLSANHVGCEDGRVLFKIFPVKLSGPNGDVEVLAFADEGSDSTVMTDALCMRLGIEGTKSPFCLEWSDGTTRFMPNSKKITLSIRGLQASAKTFTLTEVRTVDFLNLPEQALDMVKMQSQYEHLSTVKALSYVSQRPQILIGLPHYSTCAPIRSIVGASNAPLAVEMPLGWAIYGPRGENDLTKVRMNFHQTKAKICTSCKCEDMHEQLRFYMTTDAFGVMEPKEQLESLKETRAREIMETRTKYLPDEKRYETGLLWAKDEIIFPDSRVMALKRLECAERKAKNQPGGLEAYNAKIVECAEKEYVRKLTPQEAEAHSERTWYTPHSCVFNTNKVPVKLRWILDLAAEVHGVSVNTELLKGPDIYVSIIAMICQFRERPIAVTGDIKEMFLRVRLRKEDHQSLRFYWRNGEAREPDVYEFQVLPFGSKCSPYLAQSTKNVNADRFASTHPEAVKAIKNNHYVDDLMISFESEQEAIRVIKDIIYIHKEGGMEIRGFLSNSCLVMQEFNQDKADEYVNMNVDCDIMSEKVLGQWWHLKSDTIGFKFMPNKVDQSVLMFERPPTKSELLSIVMSIYDPMGFIAHYISYAKVIMREVVKQATAWNQPISDKAWMRFKFWWTRLKKLEQVKIPRWFSTHLDDPVNIELHVFCDASDDAYAAVAYLRVEGRDNSVEVSLVGAKTRVAPVKITSTPRLELQGAVLATRWADTLIKSHSIKFHAVHFHTDSMTVMGWLRCIEPRKYKPFVAFRIGEILHSTTLDQWRWVPTKLNIADDATKFDNVPENPEEDRWFDGTEFLQLPRSEWPQKRVREEPEEELRAAHMMTHRKTSSRYLLFTIPEEDPNTKALMTWNKAVNCVAFMFRAVNNFKSLLNNARQSTTGASFKPIDKLSFVRAKERKGAELFLLQKSQWETFSEEIHLLRKGMQLPNRSELKTLSPIIMDDGLIHMRSRLEYSKFLPSSTKFPIILARNHVITKMIVVNAHERFCHQSHEAVVQEMNMKFKILAIRQLVKEVKRDCGTCKIRRAHPAPPEMAPLPSARVEPNVRPFTHTGVDAFGHYDVLVGRQVHQHYGIVFTCLTCRAIHVELVPDLSADVFILALNNFTNGKGRAVRTIYSDNGTNFTGAARELKQAFKRILEDPKVGAEASIRDIEFEFNCPEMPHAGGIWEREVQSIKRVVDKLMKSRRLPVYTLKSFFKRAENIVNSQPLTYVPIDNESAPALTPNMLLYGFDDSGPSFDAANDLKDERDAKLSRKHWKYVQTLADHFWARWVKEYLPELTRRSKWHDKVEPLKIGDVVLIVDSRSKRNEYKRGRIVDAKETRSGQNREFKVLCGETIYTRPAVKLAKLEIYQDSETRQLFCDKAPSIITGGSVAKSRDNRARKRN